MENDPFIDDFPIKASIYSGFSMAMLNNQMVDSEDPKYKIDLRVLRLHLELETMDVVMNIFPQPFSPRHLCVSISRFSMLGLGLLEGESVMFFL